MEGVWQNTERERERETAAHERLTEQAQKATAGCWKKKQEPKPQRKKWWTLAYDALHAEAKLCCAHPNQTKNSNAPNAPLRALVFLIENRR